jgi:hypothetical protein
MMETTYKIVRNYFRDRNKYQVIETGLTLAEAQAHCCDPETSSSTCKLPRNVQRTRSCGPWFDGYCEE